jgi:hypothetical protein
VIRITAFRRAAGHRAEPVTPQRVLLALDPSLEFNQIARLPFWHVHRRPPCQGPTTSSHIVTAGASAPFGVVARGRQLGFVLEADASWPILTLMIDNAFAHPMHISRFQLTGLIATASRSSMSAGTTNIFDREVNAEMEVPPPSTDFFEVAPRSTRQMVLELGGWRVPEVVKTALHRDGHLDVALEGDLWHQDADSGEMGSCYVSWHGLLEQAEGRRYYPGHYCFDS